MKSISRRSLVLYVLIAVFLAGAALLYFNLVTNANTWAMNRVNGHLYSNGGLSTAGDILDREGTVLASSKDGKRIYNSKQSIRKATLHTVGDDAGYIATGAQTAFKDELTGYTVLDGVYNLKRYGKGNSLTLTINANVCRTAYEALGKNRGTVAVMNYKTGEIIAMVSTPTYDVLNKPGDIAKDTSDKYDGIYMNRFLSGLYTPGSTFKIVTAASAIENIPDIYSREFYCEGKVLIGEGYVTCSGTHGKQTFEQALNNSCNCAFAQIAKELGTVKLTATAEEMGLKNKTGTVSGKIKYTGSKINLNAARDLDLGWAGIGQYTTLVNPCQMLVSVCGIANKGTAMKPYLIKEVKNPKDKTVFTAKPAEAGPVLSYETATKLSKLLRSNVKNEYGDWRFPGLDMCGKTGTAEISDNKDAKPNALFVGYSSNEKYPYAIIVVVEDSARSITTAVPIASSVMNSVKRELG
ncbi:MAG: penicillin-binding protein [Clostridiales bacterium]|nr:penicillin-binding protein [Clostridiales bacterium]